MSCDWDVVCLDCDAKLGLQDLNHGVEACRMLVLHRADLARLADADVEVSVRGHSFNPEFFRRHGGHVLAPVSEYFDIDGDCGLWLQRNGGVVGGGKCWLWPGHAGDCESRPETAGDTGARDVVRKRAADRRRR